MPKTITRREILKFAGGSALGLLFTPLPWKLLDDSAIWTQNWALTPQLARGPISTKFSVCTLCNGGCALKAKCVIDYAKASSIKSEMPFYLSGVPNHPLTHGTLCPRGIAGHHLSHHPLRIIYPHEFDGKTAESKMTAVSFDNAMNEIASAVQQSKGSVAILDQQPGRAISEVYQKLLNRLPNGVYLTSPSQEAATLISLQEMVKEKTGPMGFDFENTKLVLSFGAPLLDGWGTPGRMTDIFNKRKESGLKLIQAESRQSRTAMQADEWLPINPGTEKIFAFAIANVLITENRYSKNAAQFISDFGEFKGSIKQFTPAKCASITGIEPEIIKNIAHQLSKAESAIVLSSADPGAGPLDCESEKVIAILNVLTGNVGRTGGIITRKEIPGYQHSSATRWTEIPDHSINVLIIDSADCGYAVPWQFIEKKLVPKENIIVTLSPYLNEISAHADYIIPGPAHLEALQDVPTSNGNSVATFALSSPLLKKAEGTTEPVEFTNALANKIGLPLGIPSQEKLLQQKVEAIYSSKRGKVFSFVDGTTTEVKEFSDVDALWTKFSEGATWIDERTKQSFPKQFTFGLNSVKMEPISEMGSISLMPYGWRGMVSSALMSPVMSKVFQETELRYLNGIVSVHPATVAQFGLSSDDTVIIKTENGAMNVWVKMSPAIRPGIIEASVGPLPNGAQTPAHFDGNNILDLCKVADDGTWRITSATLLKA